METTRLSSKGQVIIPRGVCQAHGWEAGDEFAVRDLGYGLLLVPLRPFPPARLEDVVGCAGYTGPTRTLAEMEAAIRTGATRQP